MLESGIYSLGLEQSRECRDASSIFSLSLKQRLLVARLIHLTYLPHPTMCLIENLHRSACAALCTHARGSVFIDYIYVLIDTATAAL